ncbi:MAG TPA: basic amino acid ABC transporter substrate-binding protein [Actinomycetota bacterium]|nr:basic amino acid ABC transporter substrate-binding protein [Actinomycetota bacterium]
MSKRRYWALGLVAALMLVATACAEDTQPKSQPTTPTETTPTEEAPPPTIKEGVLQVGSCLDFAPFESVEGGDEVGFDVDLSEAIAERLGLTVEWVRADFDTIFTAVASDQFDMVAAASTITEEREEVVDFSDPYYNSRQALVVNTAETPDITSQADLGEGDIVGVQKGTTGAQYAKDNLVPQGVELKTFQAAPDAFRDLEAGAVVAVVNDEPSSAELIKDLTGLEIVEPIDTDEKYGFAFSPNNPDLRDAANAALAEIIADGTYVTIFETYFPGVEVPPEFQPA